RLAIEAMAGIRDPGRFPAPRHSPRSPGGSPPGLAEEAGEHRVEATGRAQGAGVTAAPGTSHTSSSEDDAVGATATAAEVAAVVLDKGDEELLRVIPQTELPARLQAVVQALGHISYEAFALGWEADNLINGANNLFNHQRADYQAAQARLARYRLADGRPEVMEERQVLDEQGNPLFHETPGEPLMETVVVQAAIDPIPMEIDQPVYDEATG
ncbi:MAG: hypothetical protein VXZ18_17930, partial [Pseudomonadota bacterium]|nr:hypothetical protein [Pseudomonadota bacterium]